MPTVNMHAASARIARAVYRGNSEEEANARRDLASAKIRAAIEREVAKAPPLNAEQIKLLSGLLKGGRK